MGIYLKTYMGHKVDPINPDPDTIELGDIAHALSLNCRGNGQVTHFYSVAQHCINCEKEAEARGLDIRIRLACLLHDAAEAYITDFIRPVKQLMPAYEKIEAGFLEVIFSKFGLSDISKEEWKIVKEIDDDLLTYDLVELLKEPIPEEGYRCKRLPDIAFVPFEEVEEEYISIARTLIEALP